MIVVTVSRADMTKTNHSDAFMLFTRITEDYFKINFYQLFNKAIK